MKLAIDMISLVNIRADKRKTAYLRAEEDGRIGTVKVHPAQMEIHSTLMPTQSHNARQARKTERIKRVRHLGQTHIGGYRSRIDVRRVKPSELETQSCFHTFAPVTLPGKR